jgi:hypothetical protein
MRDEPDPPIEPGGGDQPSEPAEPQLTLLDGG